MDGWLLGSTLTNGFLDGLKEGSLLKEGPLLGNELGWLEMELGIWDCSLLGLVVLHSMRPSTNFSTVLDSLPYVEFSRTLSLLFWSTMYDVVLVDDGLGSTNTGCILMPVALMLFATEMMWCWQLAFQD